MKGKKYVSQGRVGENLLINTPRRDLFDTFQTVSIVFVEHIFLSKIQYLQIHLTFFANFLFKNPKKRLNLT